MIRFHETSYNLLDIVVKYNKLTIINNRHRHSVYLMVVVSQTVCFRFGPRHKTYF